MSGATSSDQPREPLDREGLAYGAIPPTGGLDADDDEGRFDEGQATEETVDAEEEVHGRFDEGQASDVTLDAEEEVHGRFDEGQASDVTLDVEEGVEGRFDEGQAQGPDTTTYREP